MTYTTNRRQAAQISTVTNRRNSSAPSSSKQHSVSEAIQVFPTEYSQKINSDISTVKANEFEEVCKRCGRSISRRVSPRIPKIQKENAGGQINPVFENSTPQSQLHLPKTTGLESYWNSYAQTHLHNSIMDATKCAKHIQFPRNNSSLKFCEVH